MNADFLQNIMNLIATPTQQREVVQDTIDRFIDILQESDQWDTHYRDLVATVFEIPIPDKKQTDNDDYLERIGV